MQDPPPALGVGVQQRHQLWQRQLRIQPSLHDSAPPLLAPDRGFARGTTWHNVWEMGDEPGWAHFIQCQWRWR